MLLALSVIGTDAVRLGLSGYKVFDERGGMIGRLESCDWILHDPEHLVSACHVRIAHRNDTYFVEDTSTHGTFINDPDRPVPRTMATPLNDGDRLFIGSFEILVQVIDDLPMIVAGTQQRGPDVLPQLSVEPDPLYRPDARKSAAQRTPPPASHITQPLKFGLPPAPAATKAADPMLRVSIDGLLEALQAQLRIRQKMQMPPSMSYQTPLQKCATADDALRTVLAGSHAGGEMPADVIKGAFREVIYHCEAAHAAMYAAAQAMIEQLDPRPMEEWSAEERDSAKWLQTHFDVVFAKAYAQQLEQLRRQSFTGSLRS